MNSFKELEKLQEEQYRNKLLKLKGNIEGNLNIFSSMTNIIELFFNNLLAFFIEWAGGDSDKKDDTQQ